MRTNLILSASVFILGGSARAEDWTAFRGPTGQGVVAGALPTEWDGKKNVVWKQAVPGNGWSSPIIHAGRVYLTAAVPAEKGDDLSLKALAFDAATGKPLWDTEVFTQNAKSAPRIHGKNSHASPTPLTDGKKLYVHFGHQGTAALDFDGKVLWKNRDLKYSPVHGNGGTPILVDDALIFSGDGADKQFVAALDRNTGKELWKTDRKTTVGKKFSFSTPLLITVDGKKQVVSPGPGAVIAYDPASGKELWKVRYGDGYSVVPRPVYGHGLVFLSSGYDTPKLLAIKPDGQGDVTDTHVAWTMTKGAPLTPSMVIAGDELYAISDQGIASCVDAKTGKVHWQERVGGAQSASPLLADGKVYFLGEDGNGIIVKASKEYEVVSKNPLKERTLASAAASDGALFIRTEKNLYRIQAK